MKDDEDEPAPPQPLPASDGGKRLPPRKTKLAYDDDNSNNSKRPSHGFVIHPCQKEMVGTAEEQQQRRELHRMVRVGWTLRRNEDWQKMVDDHCSKGC